MAVLVALVVVLTSGGDPAPSRPVAATAVKSPGGATAGRATDSTSGPPSLEAGVEPWRLGAPISRESLVADGGRLRIMGGLSPSGASLGAASWLDPRSGTVTAAGSLADVVHDGAGAQVGTTSFVFGGGSPTTFATVQSLQPAVGRGNIAGQLPQPRSDLAAAAIGRTVYLVGGYDGTTYEPSVLATDDGTHFGTTATLKVPVRYPAVVALGHTLLAFGGQTGSGAGGGATVTPDIQEIEPATHSVRIVGALPLPLYGAAAFVIDGHVYIAGGETADGQTVTQITSSTSAPTVSPMPACSPRPWPSGGTPRSGPGRPRSGTSWAVRSPASRDPTRPASPPASCRA